MGHQNFYNLLKTEDTLNNGNLATKLFFFVFSKFGIKDYFISKIKNVCKYFTIKEIANIKKSNL